MSLVNGRTLKVRLALIALLLVGYLGFRLASGNREPVVPTRQPIQRVALDANNRHELSRDESLGGHTLQRHVGKSDAELGDRLQTEDVSAASTYSDRATAEMAVAAAIRENRDKIDRWLQRPGGHSNLVLDYDSSSPIGRSMRRGETHSFPCSHAVAVLKFVNASDYYVLTSYPDCWKPS
jgi:Bacterial CdiA-CT RNAse A domain